MKGVRILIADDDPAMRTMVRVAAEARGFLVLVATNGGEALTMAREAAPDVVILDVMMPVLDGRDVCRKLRADPATRDVPILIVSARGDDLDRRAGFEVGADDYITKPVSLDQLLLKVEHLVWKRRQRAEPRQ